MGKQFLLTAASIIIAGVTLSGCESERSYSNGYSYRPPGPAAGSSLAQTSSSSHSAKTPATSAYGSGNAYASANPYGGASKPSPLTESFTSSKPSPLTDSVTIKEKESDPPAVLPTGLKADAPAERSPTSIEVTSSMELTPSNSGPAGPNSTVTITLPAMKFVVPIKDNFSVMAAPAVTSKKIHGSETAAPDHTAPGDDGSSEAVNQTPETDSLPAAETPTPAKPARLTIQYSTSAPVMQKNNTAGTPSAPTKTLRSAPQAEPSASLEPLVQDPPTTKRRTRKVNPPTRKELPDTEDDAPAARPAETTDLDAVPAAPGSQGTKHRTSRVVTPPPEWPANEASQDQEDAEDAPAPPAAKVRKKAPANPVPTMSSGQNPNYQ